MKVEFNGCPWNNSYLEREEGKGRVRVFVRRLLLNGVPLEVSVLKK